MKHTVYFWFFSLCYLYAFFAFLKLSLWTVTSHIYFQSLKFTFEIKPYEIHFYYRCATTCFIRKLDVTFLEDFYPEWCCGCCCCCCYRCWFNGEKDSVKMDTISWILLDLKKYFTNWWINTECKKMNLGLNTYTWRPKADTFLETHRSTNLSNIR